MSWTTRRITTYLLCVPIALLLTGCGASDAEGSSQQGIEGLIEPGVLQICNSDSNYPPMYYEEDGELVGLEIDLVGALAERMSLEQNLTRMAFDGMIPALTTGRCDVAIASFYLTEERLEKVNALPYMTTGVALGVPAGNPEGITEPKDLSGKTVAVEQASVQEAVVRDLNDTVTAEGLTPIKIDSYDGVTDAISAVRNGKADAFGESDLFAAVFFSEPREELEVIHQFFPGTDKVGVFYEHNSLEQPLTEAMTALISDGTLEQIFKRYNLDPDAIVASQ